MSGDAMTRAELDAAYRQAVSDLADATTAVRLAADLGDSETWKTARVQAAALESEARSLLAQLAGEVTR